jgi:hypothetical protein
MNLFKMKNIHLIPTPNPSRLLVNREDTLVLTSNYYSSSNPQNIYITSDEKIKDGDWKLKFPFGDEVFKNIEVKEDEFVRRKPYHTYPYNWCKKIILTTDQDLIKDGVQTIDDEFLNWFVKNPSCEEIEVEIEKIPYTNKHPTNVFYNYYKIIIPKEEPKEDTFCYYSGLPSPEAYVEEHKQETLEEFINTSNTPEGLDQFSYDKGLEEGAKWQAEKSYSEEEVNTIIIDSFIDNLKMHNSSFKEPRNKWAEQFKKK